jgi:hypothetical protein
MQHIMIAATAATFRYMIFILVDNLCIVFTCFVHFSGCEPEVIIIRNEGIFIFYKNAAKILKKCISAHF